MKCDAFPLSTSSLSKLTDDSINQILPEMLMHQVSRAKQSDDSEQLNKLLKIFVDFLENYFFQYIELLKLAFFHKIQYYL
jgi:hypothetical protein